MKIFAENHLKIDYPYLPVNIKSLQTLTHSWLTRPEEFHADAAGLVAHHMHDRTVAQRFQGEFDAYLRRTAHPRAHLVHCLAAGHGEDPMV
ncbi:MAG TPA: hypothetical protein ENG96_04115 [Gammaproteobacteria bacterium]|nr:hypothetical protein [Gammaproteobacteria bacterium]